MILSHLITYNFFLSIFLSLYSSFHTPTSTHPNIFLNKIKILTWKSFPFSTPDFICPAAYAWRSAIHVALEPDVKFTWRVFFVYPFLKSRYSPQISFFPISTEISTQTIPEFSPESPQNSPNYPLIQTNQISLFSITTNLGIPHHNLPLNTHHNPPLNPHHSRRPYDVPQTNTTWNIYYVYYVYYFCFVC